LRDKKDPIIRNILKLFCLALFALVMCQITHPDVIVSMLSNHADLFVFVAIGFGFAGATFVLFDTIDNKPRAHALDVAFACVCVSVGLYVMFFIDLIKRSHYWTATSVMIVCLTTAIFFYGL
jgi:hypothetical protein